MDLNHPDTVGVHIWERVEQHVLDDAEDRRGRADAERESQHSQGGEARLVPNPAYPVSEVLPDCLHGAEAIS
jgi:hypothetical protein